MFHSDLRLPTTDFRSGQALLAVVLILAVVLVLSTAALTLASGAKRVALMQEARTRAFYIADAGLEIYLAALPENPDELKANLATLGENHDESATIFDYAGGTVEVEVTKVQSIPVTVGPTPGDGEVSLESTVQTTTEGNEIFLESTGSYGNAIKKINAGVQVLYGDPPEISVFYWDES